MKEHLNEDCSTTHNQHTSPIYYSHIQIAEFARWHASMHQQLFESFYSVVAVHKPHNIHCAYRIQRVSESGFFSLHHHRDKIEICFTTFYACVGCLGLGYSNAYVMLVEYGIRPYVLASCGGGMGVLGIRNEDTRSMGPSCTFTIVYII